MKTRFLIAALLLMAFGNLKAQNAITVPMKADTIQVVMPDMSQLPELLRELGVNLQHLTDSVDWKSFEKDMRKWGEEMEEWGRKMEKWGGQNEGQNNCPQQQSAKNDNDRVKAIQVEGSGDVRITQNASQFSLNRSDKNASYHYITNGTLVLSGSSDYEVALPQLEEVLLRSSGDVSGKGTIKGKNLRIVEAGSGDLYLEVDYETIHIVMTGSGDVTLKGRCKKIYADILGSGDLQIPQLQYEESQINAKGTGEVRTHGGRSVIHRRSREENLSEKKTLLLDPHWNGFEAGLNMLFNAPHDMDIRPMRCWYFGFNLADVGVAFDKRHVAGLFTGVGIGWNNFSWNNPVTVEYDPDNAVYTIEPINVDQNVKNTKYGALFMEVPLMFEIRPTRSMYIDAGVTGGLRIAQWNRVKLEDKTQVKRFFGAGINRFKLDASLRVGTSYVGFFANYSLLPLFTMSDTKVHPVSFGFSLNF